MLKRAAMALLMLSGTACATTFTGDARFPGGARGCADKCQKDGLQMGAFVYAGEFSTACVCQPRTGTASGGVESGGSAAVGVMTQMRAQQQQQQQAARGR